MVEFLNLSDIWKLFDRKYFIHNKVQGKTFRSNTHLPLNNFILNIRTMLVIIQNCSHYCGGTINHNKTINTNSYYISISLSFMQCEVQSSCSQRSFLFINQRLLVPTRKRPGNVRQVHAMTSCSSNQLSCTVIS